MKREPAEQFAATERDSRLAPPGPSHPPMQRSTKIVATLGPASSDAAMLTRMIVAGINVVRLNFSHGSADDHRSRLETCASACATPAAPWA